MVSRSWSSPEARISFSSVMPRALWIFWAGQLKSHFYHVLHLQKILLTCVHNAM